MKVKTKFFAATGLLAGGALVAAGVTIYLLTNRQKTTSVQLKELSVTRNGDVEQSFDFNSLPKIRLEKPALLTDAQFQEDEKKYNEIPQNIEEKSVGTGASKIYYRLYVDPYTGIKFRDYSYYTDPKNPEKRRYYLGTNGLALLAYEFRRKVTFGPEVATLDSVNINDFAVIEKGANGIYIPALRQIHINTFSALESGLDIYSKVKNMMGTLFHEYMHHWASTYAEIGNPDAADNRSFNLFTQLIRNRQAFEKIPYTTKIKYYGTTNTSRPSEGYWSTYFAYNFRRLLNFDTRLTFNEAKDSIFDIDNPISDYSNDIRFSALSNYAFNHYSLNEIFTFANSSSSFYQTTNNAYTALDAKFNQLGRVNFANYGAFTSGQNGISPESIKYLYSLTELVPREWSKFAFNPYFLPSQMTNFIQNPSNPGQSWGLGWGGFYKNQRNGQSTFIPSSLGDDWSKVYLMNLAAIRNGRIGPYILDQSDIVFPNSIRSLAGSVWDNAWKDTDQEWRTSDRSKEFYQIFLNTMGYGKTISQIVSQVKQPEMGNLISTQPDRESQSNIKLLGYLPQDTKFSGLVFQNKAGSATPYQVAQFQFKDLFDFFKENNRKLENELTNNQEFKNYITKNYVNFSQVDTSKPIEYWEDKNKDNKFEPDEIVKGDITLPTSRFTTTLNSANKDYRTNSSFRWYSLAKTTDGVKIFVNEFGQ